MAELAYLNGIFGPIAEAKVSIEDRGFQFGDGVYEVVAVYGGKPFLLDRHLARLHQSAAAIGLEYDFQADPLAPIIVEGLRRCGLADAVVYIQLTRGAAPRSHVIPTDITPTVVLTFKPLPQVPHDLRRRGASAMTTPDTRWSYCYIKAITLLSNVLAKNEALRRGYDEAIFVSAEGEVREATVSNVFAVCGASLKMPPRSPSVLHGVTQGFLIECAVALDLGVDEEMVSVETLRGADEVFLSSTIVEVLGVTSIDGKPVGNGQVGDVTRRMFEVFQSRSRGATET